MDVTDAPKVFISHASEDKSFALDLAGKLRANGVDAWVDAWEILPGDKLIDKIFNQGIGQAAAFLIILSNASVTKAWVVEELDAALVRRIEKQTRIIPVRIDNCGVPVALSATVWENIDPAGDYSVALQRILASIFGRGTRPPLSKPPAVFSMQPVVGNYTAAESAVLTAILRLMADDPSKIVSASEIQATLTELTPEVLSDAVDVLALDGLLELHRVMGGAPYSFGFLNLRPLAWARHAQAVLGIDAEQDMLRVLTYLAAENDATGQELADALKLSPVRVSMAVDYLETQGFVKPLRTFGCAPFTFLEVTVTTLGKRAVR